MKTKEYNQEYYKNVIIRRNKGLEPIRKKKHGKPGMVLIPFYGYAQICKAGSKDI